MATGLLQQNFKTYSETVPIVFTFFFFFAGSNDYHNGR